MACADAPEHRRPRDAHGVRVVFELCCPGSEAGDAEAGNELCVVGSVPELGAWDLRSAAWLKMAHESPSGALWRSGEVLISARGPIQYKYIKVCGGLLAQEARGPRSLAPSALSRSSLNVIQDSVLEPEGPPGRESPLPLGAPGSPARRDRFSPPSIGPSLGPSTLPSGLPSSPLAQTPVEGIAHTRNLEGVLRRLLEAEPTNVAVRTHIRSAISAVRAAIEKQKQRPGVATSEQRRRGQCPAHYSKLSLWLAPLLPAAIGVLLLRRAPAARPNRQAGLLASMRVALHRRAGHECRADRRHAAEGRWPQCRRAAASARRDGESSILACAWQDASRRTVPRRPWGAPDLLRYVASGIGSKPGCSEE